MAFFFSLSMAKYIVYTEKMPDNWVGLIVNGDVVAEKEIAEATTTEYEFAEVIVGQIVKLGLGQDAHY